MAAAGGNHDIDVDELARNIEGKLFGEMSMPPLCSIFRVPTVFSRHNQNAYAPNAFSFGPFHHGTENLKPAEKIKAKYLHDLIPRVTNSHPNNPNPHIDPAQIRKLKVKILTQAICRMREEARQYYSGPIVMEEDKFIEVLVLDGCFIVELFRKKAYKSLRERSEKNQESDPIFSTSCLLQFLLHDLILLENQIPWMVLDTLFSLTVTPIDKKPLVQLAIEFFGNIFSTAPPPIQPLLSSPTKHILDLLRNSLVLNSSKLTSRTVPDDTIPFELEPMLSATSLKDSGIKFKCAAQNRS